MELDYEEKSVICDKDGNHLCEIYKGEPVSIYKLFLMLENGYSEEEIAHYFETKKEIVHDITCDILEHYQLSAFP